jgi:hypothetical protein
MNIQYDPLDYAQQLEATGVPKAQAEVHAKALTQVVANCDLREARNEFSCKLGETEARLRAEILASESRLRGEIGGEIKQLEARLRSEIQALALKVQKVENAIGYLTWMNGLTLALLVGLIVKLSFV